MKKELLMSLDQYYKFDHVAPYTYIIKKNGQCLYYFGSRHSYDPLNPQFEDIRNFFNDFLKQSAKESSIVLVEGGERPVAASEKEAILEGAEMSFVTYLASKEDRHIASPEIPEYKRFELLHERFPKEEIAYYCLIQACWQWNNTDQKTNFKDYIQVFLRNNREKSGWNDIDFSYENMMRIHARLFKTDFDEKDKDFLNSILDPRKDTSIINKISSFDDSGLRDNYILDQINMYWKKGLNIFIIYGDIHAIMQEPALRTLEQNEK
jgi:hypothetical protein